MGFSVRTQVCVLPHVGNSMLWHQAFAGAQSSVVYTKLLSVRKRLIDASQVWLKVTLPGWQSVVELLSESRMTWVFGKRRDSRCRCLQCFFFDEAVEFCHWAVFPVVFSDVISIEKTGEHFRLIYDVKGRFTVHRITAEEAKVSWALWKGLPSDSLAASPFPP